MDISKFMCKYYTNLHVENRIENSEYSRSVKSKSYRAPAIYSFAYLVSQKEDYLDKVKSRLSFQSEQYISFLEDMEAICSAIEYLELNELENNIKVFIVAALITGNFMNRGFFNFCFKNMRKVNDYDIARFYLQYLSMKKNDILLDKINNMKIKELTELENSEKNEFIFKTNMWWAPRYFENFFCIEQAKSHKLPFANIDLKIPIINNKMLNILEVIDAFRKTELIEYIEFNYFLHVEMEDGINIYFIDPTIKHIESAVSYLKDRKAEFFILESKHPVDNCIFMQCLLEDVYHMEVRINEKIYAFETESANALIKVFEEFCLGIIPSVKTWDVVVSDIDFDYKKSLGKRKKTVVQKEPTAQRIFNEWFAPITNREHELMLSKEYVEVYERNRKLAVLGDIEALYKIGNQYLQGLGTKRNYEKAVECFTEAVSQGSIEAQFSLGSCYFYGQGVEKDYSKAVEYFMKSANQGKKQAYHFLMTCYKRGGYGLAANYDKAIEWFIKPALEGNADEKCRIAKCFIEADHIKRNYDKAFELYSMAAKSGHSDAEYNLGKCYFYGWGIAQNYAVAEKWYKKAAKQGNIKALEQFDDDGHLKLPDTFFTKTVLYVKELPKNILELEIEDMDLSVRSYNTLKKAGINVLEDIIKMTEDELLAIKNFGIKSFNEINAIIKSYGLSFKDIR